MSSSAPDVPEPTNDPPVAVCQPISVVAGANCTAAADINNGSSDPNGDPITIVQVPAGPYPLGQTVVSLIVTDDGGLADTAACTVTVTDGTNPVVTCPANITVVMMPASAVRLLISLLLLLIIAMLMWPSPTARIPERFSRLALL